MSDQTPPTVSITSPTPLDVVSGSQTIVTDTFDDSGDVTVQFKLDGADLGSPVSSPPYQFIWDTTGVTNGQYTISAVAEDGSGNDKGSNQVEVSVANVGGLTANLWFNGVTGGGAGSCTRTTLAVYDSTKACGTLQQAYVTAQCDDTVRLLPGVYNGQALDYTATKDACTSGTRVTFEGAGSEMPGLQSNGAQHVEINDLNLLNGTALKLRGSGTKNTWQATQLPTLDWVLTDVTMETFLIRNVTDVTIQGGDADTCLIGGNDQSVNAYGVPKIGMNEPAAGVTAKPSENVIVQDCTFHDIIRTLTGTSHAECLYFDGGASGNRAGANAIDGLIVRRNTFTNCGVFNIFAQVPKWDISNVLIENNTMDWPRGTNGAVAASSMNFKPGGAWYVNWTFRNNSYLGSLRSDSGATWVNPVIIGNNVQSPSCADSIPASAYSYNVRSAAGCGLPGSNEQVADPLFVSVSSAPCPDWPNSCYVNDLRLQSGSPSINTMPGGTYAADDHDGVTRPISALGDAGAFETG